MSDLYKAYGPGKESSEDYKDVTRVAVRLLTDFVNRELYSKFSSSVSMNAVSSVFIQMLVTANIDLDEFIPLMIEAVSDFREHMKKMESDDDKT
jgi:hypothetical protein